jgi:hypothetical protein
MSGKSDSSGEKSFSHPQKGFSLVTSHLHWPREKIENGKKCKQSEMFECEAFFYFYNFLLVRELVNIVKRSFNTFYFMYDE